MLRYSLNHRMMRYKKCWGSVWGVMVLAVWAVTLQGAVQTAQPRTASTNAQPEVQPQLKTPPIEGLTWNRTSDKVSADISDGELLPLLERIAQDTGWQVFVEPEAGQKVSAKFKDLPSGEALRLLLGDLNFALVPDQNNQRLYVFKTSRLKATQRVMARPIAQDTKAKLIGNELILRLKPGANIDEIAKALGAKVVGRLDSLNLYRLRFDDIEGANAARTTLASNADVEGIENNYAIEMPVGGRPVLSTSAMPPALNLKPPPDTGAIIIGLIDTGVQPLGSDLDKFVLKEISVAGESNLDPSTPSHGTTMLGTLLSSLANITQGSSSVTVQPVNIYGKNNFTSTYDVASGIVAARNAGANVINMSFGSEANAPYVADLIAQEAKKDVTFIGAAGNQPVTTPFFPAADPGVLAVTATENGQLAPWANKGDFVDLAAPGTSVVFYNGKPFYAVGTSSAAAFTSGLAAGYREVKRANAPAASNFLEQQLGVNLSSSK